MKPSALSLILALALALAAPASAHDSYLLPEGWDAADADAWSFAPGEGKTVHFTSSASFPILEHGPEASRVVWSEVRVGGGAGSLTPGAHAETSLALDLAAPTPGVAVAALSLGPADIELAADEVLHYFEEIGAGDEVRAAYAALPPGEAFKETYTKHAKVELCAAPCEDARAAFTPSGQALEFVEIPSGPPFVRRFQLLLHGAPLVGQRVNLWDAEATHAALTTDAEGGVALADLPLGATLLSAVVLAPPAREGAPFTSDFATLTFAWRGER